MSRRLPPRRRRPPREWPACKRLLLRPCSHVGGRVERWRRPFAEATAGTWPPKRGRAGNPAMGSLGGSQDYRTFRAFHPVYQGVYGRGSLPLIRFEHLVQLLFPWLPEGTFL